MKKETKRQHTYIYSNTVVTSFHKFPMWYLCSVFVLWLCHNLDEALPMFKIHGKLKQRNSNIFQQNFVINFWPNLISKTKCVSKVGTENMIKQKKKKWEKRRRKHFKLSNNARRDTWKFNKQKKLFFLLLNYLLVTSFVRITCLAEIGNKIQNCFSHTHILAWKVLRKVWHTQHQR